MKLVSVIMDNCLFQLGALKFILGVRLHGRFLSNFNFFNVNPQMFQENYKFHHSNCLDTNFHNFSDISLRVFRRRSQNKCELLKRKFLLLSISCVNEENINFIHTTNI